MKQIGSSETIRKTTFNFYKYKQNTVSHKKHIDTTFLEWFIGFSEGDGSFIVSNQRLFFIINQKQQKILYYIRTNLGFGKVSTYGHYSRYIVADRANVDRLIFLFNGNLLLDKTNNRFCSWLSARNQYSQQSVCFLEREKQKEFGNNGWLSGFIDAEGCFNGQRLKDKRYSLGFRVRLRFILDQKDEKGLLTSVSTFLQGGHIGVRKPVFNESKERKGCMYRLSCTKACNHLLLMEYLRVYPLRTFKKVCFLRWKVVFNYIKNRKKLPWKGKVLMRVENILKNINSLKVES